MLTVLLQLISWKNSSPKWDAQSLTATAVFKNRIQRITIRTRLATRSNAPRCTGMQQSGAWSARCSAVQWEEIFLPVSRRDTLSICRRRSANLSCIGIIRGSLLIRTGSVLLRPSIYLSACITCVCYQSASSATTLLRYCGVFCRLITCGFIHTQLD